MGEEKKAIDYAYLDKVEIKGLFGKYDLEWELNHEVNILSGINGSGKSTILDSIASSLCFKLNVPEILIDRVEKTTSFFSNSNNVYRKSIVDGLCECKVISKKSGDEADYKENDSSFEILYNDVNIYKNELFNVYVIDTFDTSITDSAISRIRKASGDPGVKLLSSLDVEIYYLQKSYLDYQVNLGRRVKRAFQQGRQNYDEAVGSIYAKINLFHEIVNELFKETGKVIDEESNSLSFVMDDKVSILAFELSAGEKQLLIIFLTLLIQDEQPSIVFLDEPDNSLHIDWQRKLISKMRSLNSKAQLIIATHSPGLIMEGWGDCVSEVRDLIVNRQE